MALLRCLRFSAQDVATWMTQLDVPTVYSVGDDLQILYRSTLEFNFHGLLVSRDSLTALLTGTSTGYLEV